MYQVGHKLKGAFFGGPVVDTREEAEALIINMIEHGHDLYRYAILDQETDTIETFELPASK